MILGTVPPPFCSKSFQNLFRPKSDRLLEARDGLDRYFPFYNEQRIHQALDYRTPQDVHFASPQ